MKPKAKDELLEMSSEESASEDDEDARKLTEEVEKEFFNTLSQIKSKDPKIYNPNIAFFKDTNQESNMKKKKKSNPLTLREYEQKIILEKGGEFIDEAPVKDKDTIEPTYVQEQELLKNSLKAFLDSDSEDSCDENSKDKEWGGLFKKRDKTQKEKEKEDANYKKWLKGQNSTVPDEEDTKELKPLRDYWTDPNLNEDEKYLRDYVLNKKFLENIDENTEVEEKELVEPEDNDKNECNYRFEGEDQEFIKRYPRVMENSLRRKNDHRKKKREEVKQRKQKEKDRKKMEIKQKKKQKKKEIEEKLESLKKLTGNDKLAFENVLENDFDLDEHDKAMKRLFNEEFYSRDDPSFNPHEPIGQEDDWEEENYQEHVMENAGKETGYEVDEIPNCEDPNFNMDCDYDPNEDKIKDKNTRSRRRKDKHRRNTLSEALNQEKPIFDPATHRSFQEYLDQYYAIDCEDFIGDLACRFKYRRTVPNSYGLTVEEILAADPKELERWYSIKRIYQLRPEHKERCDAKVFSRKAADEKLKRKILPSLFKLQDAQEPQKKSQKDKAIENQNSYEAHNTSINTKSEQNKNQLKLSLNAQCKKEFSSKNKRKVEKNVDTRNEKKTRNQWIGRQKLLKGNMSQEKSTLMEMSDARLIAYGIKPKIFRNKLKYSKGLS